MKNNRFLPPNDPEFNPWFFCHTPQLTSNRQTIPIDFIDEEPQPIHIKNKPMQKSLPKSNGTTHPLYPNTIFTEKGNKLKSPTPFEMYRTANRMNIKVHPTTSIKGQEILTKHGIN